MSTSQILAATKRQAIPNPTGTCNACKRTGLPILPLRATYAPAPGATKRRRTSPAGLESVPAYLRQLRTLREGYLYALLLGSNGLKTWQAYQVTDTGALRQFPPYEMPRAAPAPLADRCVAADHDIPASFINIDTQAHTTAWLAFANDPWPKDVLDHYRLNIDAYSTGSKTRFRKIDLKAARDNPASAGLAMTEQNLQVDKSVLEYASPTMGDFKSVHGFYSRNHRLQALRGHIRTQMQTQQLKQGVLAFLLPDPIGTVQELNAQRLDWVEQLRTWQSDPKQSFPAFTSQVLLGIKELQQTWAELEAVAEAKAEAERVRIWNENPVFGDKAPLPNVDIEAEAQRRAPGKAKDAHQKLQKRYDENARKGCMMMYETGVAAYQRLIDERAALYESQWSDPFFQTAARDDYSAADLRSALSFTRMIATCLAGGPTEAIKPDNPTLGATQRLWKAQLEDSNSLLYQALLTKDQYLLAQLGKQLTSSDLGKLYDTLKSVQGTTEGELLMVKPVKLAIGQLLAGATSAGNALGKLLDEATQARIGHLHSVALLRHAGQQMTQLVVSLKVGEYFSLLNDMLSEGADGVLSEIDKNFRKPAAKKVRAMVMAGGISIASAKNGQTMLDVVVWAMEGVESVEQRLAQWRTGVAEASADGLHTLRIGAATLGHVALDASRKAISLSAAHARQAVAGALGKLRAVGHDPLLSLASLWFLQKSLRDNLAALEKSPGAGHNEALAAVWSTSVGIMGAGVEAAGIAIKVLRPAATTTVQSGGQVITVGLGARVMQYGGAVAAVAGIMDAVQYAWAADRVAAQGDSDAKNRYGFAASLAGASALAGIVGAVGTSATLLGPLGIALLLGLAAYAVATWAKKAESTPLELWARHSLWGLPVEHRQWTDAGQLDTAICALNAAVLGITAEVGINLRMYAPDEPLLLAPDAVLVAPFLQYAIQLPGYDSEHSNYKWTLTAYRHNSSPLVFGGEKESSSTPLQQLQRGKKYYDPATILPRLTMDPVARVLSINGDIQLAPSHDIQATELMVEYTPDRSDRNGFARMVVKEDKLDFAKR